MNAVRIGNASGFYGDRQKAFEEMLTGGPLDYLTGDYLAELTMGILGRDLAKDPSAGYARTFLAQMETSLGLALDHGVKIVVNAGGLNPAGLAEALRALADRLGLNPRIGYVTGDRVDIEGALAANAYLGAFGIAACLTSGADVVVTGRVTDASLTVGPAIAHFGWQRDDFDALAGATVAGHVIECGCQATGGNYPFFAEIADLRHPGFPIAEVAANGESTITKHPGTGGAVTVGTVTAQLLYEIGGPRYLGPDVTTHLDTVRLAADGPDRVRVSGVRGSPPPPTLKVGVTRLGGFRTTMTFVLCGLDIEAKADLVRAQLTDALGERGLTFELIRSDHEDAGTEETASAFLRVHHATDRPGRALSRAAVELALASYPGATLTTPPADASPFAIFEATTVPQRDQIAVVPSGEHVTIPPPKLTAEPPAEPTTAPTANRSAKKHPAEEVSRSSRYLTAELPRETGIPATRDPATQDPATRNPPIRDPEIRIPETSTPATLAVETRTPETRSPAAQDEEIRTPAARDAETRTPVKPIRASLDPETRTPGTPTPQTRDLGPGDPGTRTPGTPTREARPTRRVPLGWIVGARAGDKGSDANLGLWVRDERAYGWLRDWLTGDELARLLPGTAATAIERYELPHLRALNFVLRGFLGPGVGGSTRFDPQAKSLGEWLRSRIVDIPMDLL